MNLPPSSFSYCMCELAGSLCPAFVLKKHLHLRMYVFASSCIQNLWKDTQEMGDNRFFRGRKLGSCEVYFLL